MILILYVRISFHVKRRYENRLNWNFNQTTVFHFYDNICNQGVLCKVDQSTDNNDRIQLIKSTKSLVNEKRIIRSSSESSFKVYENQTTKRMTFKDQSLYK